MGILQNKDDQPITRHEARFGIASFIYCARRPFHPGRLNDLVLEPFFVMPDFMDDEEEDGEKVFSEEDKEIVLKVLHKKAAERQMKRSELMGELLRSKGFIWIATTNNIMGGWQQAGNVIRIEAESPWMCDRRDMWEDNPEVATYVNKNLYKANGEAWHYEDRRQELVFIGHGLKHEYIQSTLDQCLLNEEEMLLGPERWKESMGESDHIQLTLVGERIKWTIEELDEDQETAGALDSQKMKIVSLK